MRRKAPPLIPRKVLFGNPDKESPRLSPDGRNISYLAPLDGVLNVWVGPAEDPSVAQPATHDRGRGIRIYFWAFTSQHVLYLQDKDGDENWRVYCVDLASGQTRDLSPLDKVQARIQAVSPKIPGEILIALNNQDARYHDLYLVDIWTGEKRLIQKNYGFAGFVTDDAYSVRFAMRVTSDGGNELLKPARGGGWEPFIKVGMEDMLTTWPIGFDKTGGTLYLMDSRGRDTAAMATIDVDTGKETIVAENPRCDVSDWMIHPTQKNIEAVAFTYERREWRVLDDSVASDMEYLRTVADGDIEIVSRTLDDSQWIVLYLMDNGPLRYYRYRRDEKKAHFLFTHRQELEGLRLARMHPVVIKARDGLELVSYYSLPVGSDVDDDGRPDEPLPMALVVHGGPWARDNWGFNPIFQWLANRGYAALSVNFRGSTGLGKEFTNAGNREWAGKMHDDLTDAVRWAVEEGIAHPRRVAILGGSYGGYATLVGLTFTPDTFACGVDIVGPSNLVTLLETIPPYWEPQVELFKTRVGDHTTEEGRRFLSQRSPLSYAHRIKKPLLIGQGANDPRVKQSESDQIVRAMQEKSIPVTYVLFSDEGHGFARPENNLSFSAVAEAFLAKHLGGRSQPIDEDFKGSSITVPTGVEHVPDLKEALVRE